MGIYEPSMKLELHLEMWFGLFRPKEWSEDHSPVVASRAIFHATFNVVRKYAVEFRVRMLKHQRRALRLYLIFIRL
jgi:hypothetical protein